MTVTPEVPQLLDKMRAGDPSALSQLVAALYDELRRIARRELRGQRPDHTLQTTALVHEVYLKLVGAHDRAFADRAHFLAVAARAMRHVLVDYARARSTQKRANPGQAALELPDNATMGRVEILDLDAALNGLAREDQSLAQLIEMRYFGGMTAEETAQVLGQSVHVVRHDLRLAHAWLRGALHK